MMEHEEFVEKYNSNLIEVNIDKNKAGFMYEQSGIMPQNLRSKQAMIRTVGFLAILVGIVLFFFTPWWLALAVFIFGISMMPKAQKSAAKGVLEASLHSEQVYEMAVQNQVLIIRSLAE